MKTIRIFISSPSDVHEERGRAVEVIQSLRRRYARKFMLAPVVWEDLPLEPDMSFQEGIDLFLKNPGVDVAVFILWSRLGTPLGAGIRKPDGTLYRSGTEREYDLLIQARKQTMASEGTPRPRMIVYTRRDDASFHNRLRDKKTGELTALLEQKKLAESFLEETFKDQETNTNVGAYHPFDRPVTFSQRLRTHLQTILDEMAGDMDEVIWDTSKQGPPFLGLEAFQPHHADIFFGREEEILEARNALRYQAANGCAFLLLSGASGSGKSSLARAGILPELLAHEPDDKAEIWKSLVITPSELGPNPILGLLERLGDTTLLPELHNQVPSLDTLAADLARDPSGFYDYAFPKSLQAAAIRLGGAPRFVLLVDQLEELFTRDAIDSIARSAFLALLEVFGRSGDFWILATARSDFYQEIQSNASLIRMKEGRGLLDVQPPHPDAIARLIDEPARLAGLEFELRDGRRLSQRILRDAALQPELLPLVEFVLLELFHQAGPGTLLTHAAYEGLGGVEGALRRSAEATYLGLSAEAQTALGHVLGSLVTVGDESLDGEGGRPVRLHTPLAAFPPYTPARLLVDAFIHARLFTADIGSEGGNALVSVAHESLLRVWGRAQEWRKQNLDFLLTRARVGTRMKEGSPLLKGDPLFASAKAFLQTRREGFPKELAGWIERAIDHAEARDRQLAKRRRMVMASLSILAGMATAGMAVAFLKSRDEAASRKLAWAKTSEAEQSTKRVEALAKDQEKMLWLASYADHEAAIRAIEVHKSSESLAYLARALGYAPKNQAALASSACHVFGGNPSTWHIRSVTACEGQVSCVSFSPDFRYLATAGADKTARVIEVATGREISKTVCGGTVESVCFSPDGRCLAVGSSDHTARMIDVANGREIFRTVFRGTVYKVIFSPHGRYLAAASADQTARVIDVESGAEISKAVFGCVVPVMSFSPDDSILAAGSFFGGDFRVFNVITGEVITATRNDSQSVKFSPDGRYLLRCSTVGRGVKSSFQVIETLTGKEIKNVELGTSVDCVCFRPDGQHIAAANNDGSLLVIETTTGKEIGESELTNSANSMSYSPDGRHIAVCCDDKTVRMIEAATGREISKLPLDESMNSLEFSPNGLYLAAFNFSSNNVRVFESPFGRKIGCTEAGGFVSSLTISPDGRYLAGGSADMTVRLVETETGTKASDSSKFGNVVVAVSFSPDGQHLAAGSWDNTVRVIEVASGKEMFTIQLGEKATSVSFSPDGRYLAAGGQYGAVRLMDAATGEKISNVNFGSAPVIALSFSPDSRYAAAGSRDTVGVIESSTGNVISKMAHEDLKLSMSFSPDGRFFVVSNVHGTIRVNETTSGKRICTIEVGNSVNSVSLSPDCRYLAAACTNKTARVFECATGREISNIDFMKPVSSTNFSPDGRILVMGFFNGIVRIVDMNWIRLVDMEASHIWPVALGWQSGLRFQANGQLQPIPADELIAAQTAVQTYVAAAPPEGEHWQHAILKWVLMPPDTRTTSPWTEEPVRVAAGRWFMQSRTGVSVEDTADEAPWHPLEPISLARIEKRPDDKTDPSTREQMLIRPCFLARLTLKRLRDADEKVYGRDTLAEYAAWSAKIMHEELGLDPEALEAIDFAIERTPPEKRTELDELKSRIAHP